MAKRRKRRPARKPTKRKRRRAVVRKTRTRRRRTVRRTAKTRSPRRRVAAYATRSLAIAERRGKAFLRRRGIEPTGRSLNYMIGERLYNRRGAEAYFARLYAPLEDRLRAGGFTVVNRCPNCRRDMRGRETHITHDRAGNFTGYSCRAR